MCCFSTSFEKLDETVENHAVIGAGPVGLAVAIHSALRGNRVTVYEKRPDFTRNNIVNWNPKALPFWKDERAAVLHDRLTGKMSLASIQSVLADFADSIGVTRVLRDVEAQLSGGSLATYSLPDDVLWGTSAVFIATGSKSKLVDNLFGSADEVLSSSTVCTFTANINPETKRRGKKMGFIDWYKTQKELPGTAIEVVHGGKATLLMELRDVSITRGGVEVSIKNKTSPDEAARIWAGARGDVLSLERRDYTSTTFRHSQFTKMVEQYSREVCSETRIYLIGDCAYGVPYQKSLSNGIEQVAFCLDSLEKYQLKMKALSSVHIGRAALFRLTAASAWTAVVGSVLLPLTPSWSPVDIGFWKALPTWETDEQVDVLSPENVFTAQHPPQEEEGWYKEELGTF